MKYLTFVLGAGASKAYGFPIGYELVDEIINLIEREIEEVGGTPYIGIRQELDILRDKILVFDPDSIDAFIQQHYGQSEDNKTTPNIKQYISRSIFKNFSKKNFGRGNPQNWMKYLFAEIYRFLRNHPAAEDIPIKIITFNYDTSLEYYFHRQINLSGFLSAEERKRFRKLFAQSLVHVHGQLGNYSWQKDWLQSLSVEGVDSNWLDNFLHPSLGNEFDLTEISHHFAHRISTIGNAHNQKIADKAKDWLMQSQSIVISGYSFSPENNGIIGLLEAIKNTRTIVGLYQPSNKLRSYVNSLGTDILMLDATTYQMLSNEITLSAEYQIP